VASDVNIIKQLLVFLETGIEDFKENQARAQEGEDYDYFMGVADGLESVRDWINENT